MHVETIVAVPLVLVAVALLAFQRGHAAGRRSDGARTRLLSGIVADAMAAAGDRAAADAVAGRLATALDADAAAIGYVDAGRLHLVGSDGAGGSLAPGEGLPGRVWERARPLVAGDVTAEPGHVPRGDGVRSGVYVPGKARGRVALVLCVESRRRDAFTADDVLLLGPLADLLASLLESRRMLREAEQLEERLLTLVGHEMRTPLTTIFGALTTLRHYADRLDDAARAQLLDAGLRGSRRLERLVDALLTAARLDADEVTFRRTPLLVHGVVVDAVTTLDAADRVAVDVPSALAVAADPVHLGTVVQHLVENAIRHGGGGPVEVVASAGRGVVTLAVRDEGPGIAADQQEAALGRFRQIGERTVPGTGLGLYVARRLVEGMGGELALRSAPGEGCAVVVRLPAADTSGVVPRQPGEQVARDAGG